MAPSQDEEEEGKGLGSGCSCRTGSGSARAVLDATVVSQVGQTSCNAAHGRSWLQGALAAPKHPLDKSTRPSPLLSCLQTVLTSRVDAQLSPPAATPLLAVPTSSLSSPFLFFLPQSLSKAKLSKGSGSAYSSSSLSSLILTISPCSAWTVCLPSPTGCTWTLGTWTPLPVSPQVHKTCPQEILTPSVLAYLMT